jgi:hypothetical protein
LQLCLQKINLGFLIFNFFQIIYTIFDLTVLRNPIGKSADVTIPRRYPAFVTTGIISETPISSKSAASCAESLGLKKIVLRLRNSLTKEFFLMDALCKSRFSRIPQKIPFRVIGKVDREHFLKMPKAVDKSASSQIAGENGLDNSKTVGMMLSVLDGIRLWYGD